MRAKFLMLPALFLMSALPALGENAELKPVAEAKLTRVDDGVFELKHGQSKDLTDRKVLLTFLKHQGSGWPGDNATNFMISIAGRNDSVNAGTRIDLKQFRSTEKAFEDKAECFLDVVDFVAPRGAAANATFRLSCL